MYRSERRVTLPGGDPLYQGEFSAELITRWHEEIIHTSIETSGYGNYGELRNISQNLDLLLFGIKHMDGATHTKKEQE